MMETEVIRYNLTERGRTYRGVERNFDIPAIVRAVNAPDTQERVSHRDMLGYFGHWPRIKFGMMPMEGGVIDGKAVAVEPAIRTTYLRALSDGTIEHKAEFLDTNAGRVAARLYGSKAGGFSSAIDETPRVRFYGFDYVFEPNYSTNRGYEVALDDANGTFDAVEEYTREMTGALRLLDSVLTEHDRVMETVGEMARKLNDRDAEVEQLLSMLSARGVSSVVLDSIESINGISSDPESTVALRKTINAFRTAELVRRVEPKSDEKPQDENLLSRFLR
jgi:hypothetical protein